MKLIDSHCHLDFDPLTKDLEGVLERAKEVGVEKIINIGSSIESSKKSVVLSEKYPNIWATVGLHPHDVGIITDLDKTLEEVRQLSNNKKVVAIGEIGLDYFHLSGGSSLTEKNEQKILLKGQIKIALEKKLPIIFHVRDAWEDFFEIIGNWKLEIGNYPKGVVHCYTGGEEVAKKIIDMGFYIGFTGFITFSQSKFNYIKKAVKVTPIEKILIETDAPFLAPEPYRGKVNEPAYVIEIIKKIAELKGESLEKVASTTAKNTTDFFGLELD